MYTISELAREMFADGWAVRPLPHVQVLHRREVLCGRPVDAFEAKDGTELFKVATQIGEVCVPGKNVMLCAGVDGRCVCSKEEGIGGCGDEAGERSEHGSAALTLPPLGNTGGTVSAGGTL